MIHKFFGGKVILGNTVADDIAVYTKGDRIVAVTRDDRPFDAAHDAGGKYISPGFIDIHVHGGMGRSATDGDVDSFLIPAELHAKHGTTTMLPAASTAPKQAYIDMFEAFAQAQKKNTKGAYMPGIHMEGPYFSPAQCGGQDKRNVRNFDKAEYELLTERYGHMIKRWSAAPELPGMEDFARTMREAKIDLSIGHSDAEYETVLEAYDLGFTCVTHLYSCCSTVHRVKAYRHAGIIEAAYMLDGMDVEIIADGKHLPPVLLKYIYKFKGVDRISLITDATQGAGLPEGPIKNKDGTVRSIIEDGVAFLPDFSAFSGSVSYTNMLVRNMIKLADVPLLDAVRMATANPARMGSLPDRGVIHEGAYADIVIFDDDINVSLTMSNGNVIFEA